MPFSAFFSRIASIFGRRSANSPAWKSRLINGGAIVLTTAYFLFAILILVLRLAILPQIESYRPEIERRLSDAIQREVKIQKIEAYWVGLNPALTLHGLEIKDDKGRAALTLEKVETELAWDSLASLRIRLARFEIVNPSLVVRRSSSDVISVAGIGVDQSTSDLADNKNPVVPGECSAETTTANTTTNTQPCQPTTEPFTPQNAAVIENDAAIDWLLAQHRTVIRDANVVWIDELRQAPPLELKRVNFSLEKTGGRHRFGFTAQPPQALASRIDFRADFRGSKLSSLNKWQGETYLELDYADLAAWRKWFAYPIELPHGQGALRLWLGVDQGQISSLTADVRLDGLRTKLRKDLPELNLAHLEGRISGRWVANDMSVNVRNLSLATHDGIRIAPTDVGVSWSAAHQKEPAHGSIKANHLDLDALARLTAHLPVDTSVREQLDAYAPGGVLHDLEAEWTGDTTALLQWKVASRFEKLRLTAQGSLPGVEGISGSIDGTDRGGQLSLSGQQAALNFPRLFEQSRIELTSFVAQLRWRALRSKLRDWEITMEKLTFANQDFTGDGHGSWHATAEGGLPKAMKLNLVLKRAKVASVWRYLPNTVGDETRHWIQQSLHGGELHDVTMQLEGDLVNYPFRGGKSGTFVVNGNFSDTRLDYADHWPAIDALSGDLLFENETMRIRGKSGTVFGATIKDVIAELPDLEAGEQILTVKGKAAGPTSDFMHFIDTSPVKESIDNAIEDMRATGNGELDLKLVIPLTSEAPAQIDGTYRFLGNRVVVGEGLPPLTEMNGRIKFTGNNVESKGLRANWLGSPMIAELKAGPDGTLNINGSGEISVAGLRSEYPMPLFDHLSGSAKWTGNIRVKKKVPEILISSTLVGLSSSLPLPFNKTGAESMLLRVERKAPQPAELRRTRNNNPRAAAADPPTTIDPRVYDTIDLSLGKIALLKLQRHGDRASADVARGLMIVSANTLPAASSKLPDQGVQILIDVPRINLDFWRPMFATDPHTHKVPNDAPSTPSVPVQFNVHADELQVFAKQFGNLSLTGNRVGNLAHFTLTTTEVSGDFEWDSRGNGKLSGKIPRFTVPDPAVTLPNVKAITASDLGGDDTTSQIPAFDITIGKLMHKDRELGSLDLQAENVGGDWRGRFDIHNDDAILKGTALWRPLPAPVAAPISPSSEPVHTTVEFDVDAKNMENLLERFGYGDTMHRGTAKINGKLSWQGSPLAFHYPSLGGKFKVDLDDGQFKQLEPGVGGRLLGVLSLSSLPRRITLNFRDIFSKGFAFDSIEGDVVVSRGVMETTNMEIRGPAAKVLFRGSVNLANETQDLKVSVQPAIGETIAVGTMLINPAAGAALWLSQKLFKDPVGQALSYDYTVSGSWSDPKVVELGKGIKPASNPKVVQ